MDYDAVVVGSGPNGLAASITMALAGCSVIVFEAAERVGGGARSAELTLPGFTHDICSAIHPLGAGSPFFRALPLSNYGLEWIDPPAALAHPLDDSTVAMLEKSPQETAQTLGIDEKAYIKFMSPFASIWPKLESDLLGPLRFPQHPIALGRFGWFAFRPAYKLAKQLFSGGRARALFAGLAAHAIMPLQKTATSAFAMVLGVLGHTVGWPLPRGGAQRISDALADYFISLKGELECGQRIEALEQLPSSRVTLLDVTPGQMLQIAGERLPERYRQRLGKYRYGPGVFKVDWALRQRIPFKSAQCQRAGTVHLGGTLEEIAAGETAVWQGEHPEKPFVLLTQPSLFDSTRAPAGRHTAWAYCHVPNGSQTDMKEQIENQIERFAPGFRDCILARHTMNTAALQQYNPNYVGGDINGGVQDIRQLFTRPVTRWVPYSTPVEGLYLCSSSTPPGGGVHGMCGYHAARAALKQVFNIKFQLPDKDAGAGDETIGRIRVEHSQ